MQFGVWPSTSLPYLFLRQVVFLPVVAPHSAFATFDTTAGHTLLGPAVAGLRCPRRLLSGVPRENGGRGRAWAWGQWSLVLQQVLVILTIVVSALVSNLGTRHGLLVTGTKIHMMRLRAEAQCRTSSHYFFRYTNYLPRHALFPRVELQLRNLQCPPSHRLQLRPPTFQQLGCALRLSAVAHG